MCASLHPACSPDTLYTILQVNLASIHASEHACCLCIVVRHISWSELAFARTWRIAQGCCTTRYLHCYTHQIKIDNNSKLETWLHSWTFWANKLGVCTLLSKNLIAREQLCLGMQHHLKKQTFAYKTAFLLLDHSADQMYVLHLLYFQSSGHYHTCCTC